MDNFTASTNYRNDRMFAIEKLLKLIINRKILRIPMREMNEISPDFQKNGFLSRPDMKKSFEI